MEGPESDLTQNAVDQQIASTRHDNENESSDTDISSAGEETNTKSLKRKRSSKKISCEICKARKVKCDKAEPSCSWCAQHGKKCIYRERKRPGVRAVYELDLEEKINKLEATLEALNSQVQDHIAADGRADANDHLLSPAFRLDTTPSFLQRHSSRNGVTPTYSGSFVEFGGTEADLPPDDLLYSLVDLYFKHVATWSPILDRKNTFNVLFGRGNLEEPDRILLYAIVAVTLRFSKDPRLTSRSRQRYHDTSKQKVQLYGLENPNIQALQALVILAIDILGTSNGPQGWNLLALIARNVVQLGLNVEKSVYLLADPYPSISCLQAFGLSQPTSWTENEARRRLLWMVYVLDRYTTISTTFNFTLQDDEIDRPLPCSYDLFSQNQPVETKWFTGPESVRTTINHQGNLGSFAYHVEVLRILSRIHRFLNRELDAHSQRQVDAWFSVYAELDHDLNTFIASLPGGYDRISQLCHSDPASKVANWIMLHAAFVLSVIRLHSAAAFPIAQSMWFKASSTAIDRCLSAVQSLKAIAADVIESGGLDLLGPPFAFTLWVSARVLLVHAAASGQPISPDVQFFISALESMGQYWQVASRYASILAKVVQEDTATRTQPFTNQSVSTMSLVHMRQTAANLDQLVAKRPRSVLDPTSTKMTKTKELEYLDVFKFFNYPRTSTISYELPPLMPSGRLG